MEGKNCHRTHLAYAGKRRIISNYVLHWSMVTTSRCWALRQQGSSQLKAEEEQHQQESQEAEEGQQEGQPRTHQQLEF